MRTMVAVLLLTVGCHQTPEQRCASLIVKQTKRAENCGIVAARPADEVKKQCAGATDAERAEMIQTAEYLLGADNCEAMKARGMALAEKAMKAVREKAWEDFTKKNDMTQFTPEQVEQLKRTTLGE